MIRQVFSRAWRNQQRVAEIDQSYQESDRCHDYPLEQFHCLFSLIKNKNKNKLKTKHTALFSTSWGVKQIRIQAFLTKSCCTWIINISKSSVYHFVVTAEVPFVLTESNAYLQSAKATYHFFSFHQNIYVVICTIACSDIYLFLDDFIVYLIHSTSLLLMT